MSTQLTPCSEINTKQRLSNTGNKSDVWGHFTVHLLECPHSPHTCIEDQKRLNGFCSPVLISKCDLFIQIMPSYSCSSYATRLVSALAHMLYRLSLQRGSIKTTTSQCLFLLQTCGFNLLCKHWGWLSIKIPSDHRFIKYLESRSSGSVQPHQCSSCKVLALESCRNKHVSSLIPVVSLHPFSLT